MTRTWWQHTIKGPYLITVSVFFQLNMCGSFNSFVKQHAISHGGAAEGG